MIDDQLLIDRIRRPRPEWAPVVDGSLPVTSFGDLKKARVATVAINPSVREFRGQSADRPLLPVRLKRFIDRESLGLGEFEIPSPEQAARVAESCTRYFDGNPLWQWFRPMQTYVLDPLGLSYQERSAVHLDLVQWATDPVWSKMKDASAQARLVEDDLPFLRALISQGDFELILLNGLTVVETFRRFGLFEVQREEKRVLGGSTQNTLYSGTVGGRRALGWTLYVPGQNLPSQKQGIAEWLEGQRR